MPDGRQAQDDMKAGAHLTLFFSSKLLINFTKLVNAGYTWNMEVFGSEPQRPSPVRVPEVVTAAFIDSALNEQMATVGDRTLFVRQYPQNVDERLWLANAYGAPVPGDSEDSFGYFFHGTRIADLPGIAQFGVFGVPNNPTVATGQDGQVLNAAKRKQDSLHRGCVAVFRGPWSLYEQDGNGFPESIGVPAMQFTGDRTQLPIPQHLMDAADLRQLPPEYLIGFYIVQQPTSA